MAIEIMLRRHLGALRPINAMGEEQLADLPAGVVFKAVLTSQKPRSITYFNKFFALLTVLYPHQSYYPTMLKFRKAVTIALGFAEETVLPSGKIMVEAESIAWHKMKEADFEQLMKRFFELAETRILPGIDRKDVEREWEEVMKGYQNT